MADSKTVGQRKEEELISKTKNVWLKADEEYARKFMILPKGIKILRSKQNGKRMRGIR